MRERKKTKVGMKKRARDKKRERGRDQKYCEIENLGKSKAQGKQRGRGVITIG